MVKKIDLNTDAGESFGRWRIVDESELFKYVSSVNIACGFHAGDPLNIWRSVRIAKSLGVAIGAHPGFPDLIGFGRREMIVDLDELKSYVIYQLGALDAFLRVEGLKLQHVKVHGALYNMAWVREDYAKSIAEAVAFYDRSLIIVAPHNSQLARVAEELGLRVAYEAFIDRGYTSDGRLVPRRFPEAVISDVGKVVERAVSIVDKGVIQTVNGKFIEIKAHTLCIHGDSPNAIEFAEAVSRSLKEIGIEIKPIAEVLQSS
ncbi:MAG: 5-oxoprolinase subunit PxpA [Desulfurococcaceae archaeon TW002]